MTSKFEKALKIGSDLLSYCHHKGATDYELDIKETPDSVSLVITAVHVDLTYENLERLETLLHAPRQRDVEQDYWVLMGSSEDFCELTLVGMLCDEAVIEYKDMVLKITLKRHD